MYFIYQAFELAAHGVYVVA